MRIDPTYLDRLHFLAEQLEDNDYFAENTQEFIGLLDRIKRALYRNSDQASVHRALDQLPEIELQPYRRGLLEQLLPRGARDMVGKAKSRSKIREQVQKSLQILNHVQDLLSGEEYV
ncbi:MAG: hypothetical protein AAF798_08585 [Bacteroidota bacterium]